MTNASHQVIQLDRIWSCKLYSRTPFVQPPYLSRKQPELGYVKQLLHFEPSKLCRNLLDSLSRTANMQLNIGSLLVLFSTLLHMAAALDSIHDRKDTSCESFLDDQVCVSSYANLHPITKQWECLRERSSLKFLMNCVASSEIEENFHDCLTKTNSLFNGTKCDLVWEL